MLEQLKAWIECWDRPVAVNNLPDTGERLLQRLWRLHLFRPQGQNNRFRCHRVHHKYPVSSVRIDTLAGDS